MLKLAIRASTLASIVDVDEVMEPAVALRVLSPGTFSNDAFVKSNHRVSKRGKH